MADVSKQLRIMRKLFILFLALLPSLAWAQTFDMETATFTKVCETDLTQDEIYGQILAYNILENVVTHGNMIAGDLIPRRLNYEAAGYTRMKVPLYLSNDRFGGRMILRFKEGRFKAEVIGMYFLGDIGTLASGRTSITAYMDTGNFDITVKLIISYLNVMTTYVRQDDEW